MGTGGGSYTSPPPMLYIGASVPTAPSYLTYLRYMAILSHHGTNPTSISIAFLSLGAARLSSPSFPLFYPLTPWLLLAWCFVSPDRACVLPTIGKI